MASSQTVSQSAPDEKTDIQVYKEVQSPTSLRRDWHHCQEPQFSEWANASGDAKRVTALLTRIVDCH